MQPGGDAARRVGRREPERQAVRRKRPGEREGGETGARETGS